MAEMLAHFVPDRREVVAVVALRQGRVALLKRSAQVQFDRGRWHCVTGFLEASELPLGAAARELYEETGLGVADLSSLHAGPTLSLPDESGRTWLVHTFLASTMTRRLSLNWEHDDYRWVSPQRLPRFDGQVGWLGDVVAALVGPELEQYYHKPTGRNEMSTEFDVRER